MKIVKLGGSIITDKKGFKKADKASIRRLVRVVAKAWNKGVKDLVIVHGAGSFGHAPVMEYDLNKGIKTGKHRLGFADTHLACSQLSNFIVAELINNSVPAVSLPPISIIIQNNRRISKFNHKHFLAVLKAGYVPVLYGDMVLDTKLKGSVVSGDQIVSYLGKMADLIVLATDVNGVLVGGKVVPEINKSNFKEISKHLGGAESKDVTGGMAGKVKELMGLKADVYVVNGTRPDRIYKLLIGEKVISTYLK